MPSARRTDLIERILNNVEICPASGCWNWKGGTSGEGRGGGYGRISVDGHTSAVHRVMYVCVYGYIPAKKQVDHECTNRLCCNPKHMKLVTHRQNQRLRDKRRKQNE